jgi:hypothetical protein
MIAGQAPRVRCLVIGDEREMPGSSDQFLVAADTKAEVNVDVAK